MRRAWRNGAVHAVVVAVGLLGLAGISTAAPRLSNTRPLPAGKVGALALLDGQAAPLAVRNGGYRYVILREADHDYVGAVRRANPGAAVLLYKNAAGAAQEAGRDGITSGGVGWSLVDEDGENESWKLRSTEGAWVSFCDYDYYRAMRVDDPGYQKAWVEAVRGDLRRWGFDGVFIDDLNAHLSHCLDEAGTEYATDGDYAAAMTRFVATVGPALQNDGLVAANVGGDPWVGGQFATMRDWARSGHIDVFVREHFVRWGPTDRVHPDVWRDDSEFGPLLAALLDLVMEVETASAATAFVGITYGAASGDEPAERYARALFALASSGQATSALIWRPDGPVDPWGEEWTWDPGPPLQAREVVDHGRTTLWQRRFVGGIVIANVGNEPAMAYTPGGVWVDSRGRILTEVTVAPGDAVFLKLLMP